VSCDARKRATSEIWPIYVKLAVVQNTRFLCCGHMTLTGYNRLPKGSVVTQFLYNLLESGMDKFASSGCNFLQYADDIMVYSSHHVLQTACVLVQTAYSSLSVFFSLLGLTISPSKSEVVLFSRRHLEPSVSIRIGGRLLPQFTFQVFGSIFLCWILKSIVGTWWSAYPRCMIILYRGLVGSMLEYSSICYSGMARTHYYD
jgi:hypothetical protein